MTFLENICSLSGRKIADQARRVRDGLACALSPLIAVAPSATPASIASPSEISRFMVCPCVCATRWRAALDAARTPVQMLNCDA
jgi:hypothetical protein